MRDHEYHSNQKFGSNKKEREKHFEEMRKKMSEEHSKTQYITNKDEKTKPIYDQFEYIKWGEEHPFLSHWVEQVSNMAPNGKIVDEYMWDESSTIGFNLNDFREDGIDLKTELVYTGHIEYEEKMKEYNIHVTNKVFYFLYININYY